MAVCEETLMLVTNTITGYPCHRHLGHTSTHQTLVGKNFEGWANHTCTPGTYPDCCYPGEKKA